MVRKSPPDPSHDNICAVVVSYHPDAEFYSRIEKIRHQVDRLLIVDNNSSLECLAMIRSISTDLNVELILNESNMGVAKALNQGFRYFSNMGEKYHWILCLDQDSICKSNLVKDLIFSYKDCPVRSEVGIIGSNYVEKSTQKILHATHDDCGSWEEVKNLPTSGSLTSLAAYFDVGDFREDFFIDYVDTEYCMRLRENGYRILISLKIGMIHPLGYYRKSQLHRWLKGNPLVTSYPAVRHYYWTRNGAILIGEHLTRDFAWSLSQIYYIFYRRIITIVLFEDEKFLKLKNVVIGVLHACLGVGGRKIE